METMCLPEATVWSIPCASKEEPVGDIGSLEAFAQSGLEGKGENTPSTDGCSWRRRRPGTPPPRCASPRYFPKDFLILPRRQLRPPEVARILMEAAGRDP
ncbi:hypothetical protein J7J35_02850 [Candidatus Bipolaricaulota bacterium]|nr:hypothetical protein [Candidatus Bipolaricaulota bacterium]